MNIDIPVKGIPQEIYNRLIACCDDLILSIDKHIPELRKAYFDIKDFETRVFMVLYIELIHAGFFGEDDKE